MLKNNKNITADKEVEVYSNALVLCNLEFKDGVLVSIDLGLADYHVSVDGKGNKSLLCRPANDREQYPSWPNPETVG